MGSQQVLEQNPFLGGKAAMTIGGSDYVQELRRAAVVLKDRMPLWDLVTVPVDAKRPDTGNALWLQDITAINSGSAQVEAAWTFVRYMNGDSFARAMAKAAAAGGKLMSRTAYLKDEEGRNLNVFHALKLDPNVSRGTGKVPQTFYFSFEALAKQEIGAAFEGRKTIDEALKVLQQKGQELLGIQ
jgi:multiple sugar transport system substrate-binding protein